MLQRGHSGNGCDLVSTLCMYDLRKGDLFVTEWSKGTTSEAGKYVFRAANLWWRCAQYFDIVSCSAMLFILRSRLLLYSAESGLNRVKVVLSVWIECEIVLSRHADMVVCIYVCSVNVE